MLHAAAQNQSQALLYEIIRHVATAAVAKCWIEFSDDVAAQTPSIGLPTLAKNLRSFFSYSDNLIASPILRPLKQPR